MFPIITISGAARARGTQYGAQAANEIRHSIASYARLFAYVRGLDWAAVQAEARGYLPVIAQHAPDLVEEMRGVAEGAAVAFESILALNARTELIAGVRRESAHPNFAAAQASNRAADVPMHGECTTVAALPAATASGKTLLAQTWDWYGEQRAACVVLRIHAPGEPDVLTVTEAGILAKIGLNDAGLGVSLNILFSDLDGQQPGMPVHIQLRRMLQQCSVAEAAALAHNIRAGASSCITLADAHKAVSLEISPGGVRELQPVDGVLAHTNHCVLPPLMAIERPQAPSSSSEPRLARADAWLHASHGTITAESLQALLRDRTGAPLCICREPSGAATEYEAETVLAVILDLAAGVMHLAPNVPSRVAFTAIAVRR